MKTDVYFLIISRCIQFRMRNISVKCRRANRNMHFMFNSFSPENRADYWTMWINVVNPDRPQMTI